MFFSAFTHCALARIPVPAPEQSLQFRQVDTGLQPSDFRQEGDRTQLFDRAVENSLVRRPHRVTSTQTHLHIHRTTMVHHTHV